MNVVYFLCEISIFKEIRVVQLSRKNQTSGKVSRD